MNKYQITIENLVNSEILKTPKIIDAFKRVDRKNFMPEGLEELSHFDDAFHIGFGQTISQPLTVAIMIELLRPKEGNTILEIGYGSGWVTAILSEIVGKSGKIYSYEIIPEIAKFGEENLKNHFRRIPANIRVHKYNFEKDYLDNSPYDRIISSASFSETPKRIFHVIKDDGRFIFPTDNHDIRVVQKKNGKVTENIIPGFVFVPITR